MRAQKTEKNFDYQKMDSTVNEIQIWNNFTALFISKVTNLPQKELRLLCKLNFDLVSFWTTIPTWWANFFLWASALQGPSNGP